MKPFFLYVVCMFFLLSSISGYCAIVKPIVQTDSLLTKLKDKKVAVDKSLKRGAALFVFVKIPGKKTLIKIKNDHWPDEVEYTYNILKNASGKIIFIAQIPYSESGDWDIEYKHYFDEQGKTYAFNKEESIFGDNSDGGVIRDILVNYYDENFTILRHVNYLTDKNYEVIKRNRNNYDFRDYKYTIYKNANDCLMGYNIKLPN